MAGLSGRPCGERPQPRADALIRLSLLQRLTVDETWQVAGKPHRVAHQEPLERRQAVNRSEAEIAGESQRRELVREQAVEPVGHHGEGEPNGKPIAQ